MDLPIGSTSVWNMPISNCGSLPATPGEEWAREFRHRSMGRAQRPGCHDRWSNRPDSDSGRLCHLVLGCPHRSSAIGWFWPVVMVGVDPGHTLAGLCRCQAAGTTGTPIDRTLANDACLPGQGSQPCCGGPASRRDQSPRTAVGTRSGGGQTRRTGGGRRADSRLGCLT